MSQFIGLRRARDVVDRVLPEHTYRGSATGGRFWNTPAGQFRVMFIDNGPDSRVEFIEESAGWQVRVPCTVAGLDALIASMRLAGAIEASALSGIAGKILGEVTLALDPWARQRVAVELLGDAHERASVLL